MADDGIEGFVAVHAGAGFHSPNKTQLYSEVCQLACKKAAEALHDKKSALDAVVMAVTQLENSACTNAGIGSNLTLDGTVECDASVMDGASLKFGAVGAVESIKNPVKLASCLLTEQKKGYLSLGRVPPCFLVGRGAVAWAVEHNIEVVEKKDLITDSSLRSYRDYQRRLDRAEMGLVEPKKMKKDVKMVEEDDSTLLDTVGAVCLDCQGNMAAAVSSGGIALKCPGRVGQAAVFGCGCWADNIKDVTPGVAVSTSGCGEHLIYTQLARECALEVRGADDISQAVTDVFSRQFIESDMLSDQVAKYGGAIVLKYSSSAAERREVELVWAHTTESMCIGYMKTGEHKPKVHISRMPSTSTVGQTTSVMGKYFHLR
ncbi:threonine aspartase 1 [Lingula anatina]|uniref:Threonine aspartase 1 n=1 Tax=Lingula anatina TaxID=7574 RepID=A0A1S3KID6_LINAN|nr:threonine aspartase 1 [Lingula anatina]|eukprot:XP_013421976.1 threonine aspartase 1 [Lingula anatina]